MPTRIRRLFRAGALTLATLVLAAMAWPVSAQTTAPASTPPAAASPQVAPSPQAAAASAAPGTEEVENPYGLTALWNGGDDVARGTLGVLLLMSMGSWYVIITKLIEQMILARQARRAERQFWRAPNVSEGIAALDRRSAFRAIAEDGLRACEEQGGTLTAAIDAETRTNLALQHATDAVTDRMQRGLALLATVGSTAPFVGLFGTVWGIYHALTAIGIAGQASIDKVAGPVGEALIMTAMGLAVAVPAVLGYNWLIRRNKAVLDRVRRFAADVTALFGGARPAAAARSA